MAENLRCVNNDRTVNVQDSVKTVSKHGLLRSTAVFGSMTFISRLAGLARDLLQASLFGTGAAVSAFVIAYRIPNYLRRIFAEGSFSSAFVPVLSELREKGDAAQVQDFLNHIAGALLAAVLVVTACGIALSPWLARLFLLMAGKDSELVGLTADMMRITFPYLAFISMTALAGAVMNSFRHFGLPAFIPVLHNLAIIFAMLVLAQYFRVPAFALAWGVFLAGLLQFCVMWPALRRFGLKPHFKLDFKHPGVQRVFKLMLPTVFSSSVAQLNLLVGTVFASALVVNAQSWLYYSDRLTEFPLGLFGVAIGTVILPHLSRQHAAENREGYNHALDWGMKTVCLIGIPAAVGLMILAEPLCASLFQYGKFDAEDTRMVAAAVSAMSIGIPAFMLSKVLLPAFFSRHDTKTPMHVAVWTVFVNIVLIALMVTVLRWLASPFAHVGIALATALAGIFNAIALQRILRREGVYSPEAGWGRWLLKIAAACTVMAAVVLLIRWQVGDWRLLPGLHRIGWLLVAVIAGASSYLATHWALGLRLRHLREV
jgi:putative peptidoglycan lipid II flippase